MTGPQRQTYALGVAAMVFLAVFFVYFFWPKSPAAPEFPAPDRERPASPTRGLVYRPDGMGIRFHHQHAAPLRDIAHVTGSGVCLADFNGDDHLDVFLVNASPSDSQTGCEHGLFVGDGRGRFTAVPGAGGVACDGLSMAAVAGDYDNDGDLDLFITRVGPDRLFRNDGAGRFEDVTAAAGISTSGWGTAAAWADYDRDGDLDLFVANYVTYDPAHVPTQPAGPSDRDELAAFNPYVYDSEPDRLLRNDGDGTFSDVTERARLEDASGKGLGAVFVDLNDDDWPDIYVVNDVSTNRLYLNRRDGTFEEAGGLAGVADPRSGMGITVGDVDGDGRWDLFSTHWQDELNVLYRHVRDLEGGHSATTVPVPLFGDVTARAGLARHALGLGATGWGAVFFDADHDGDLDLYWTNGYTSPAGQAVDTCVKQPDLFAMNESAVFAPATQLLRNVPPGAGRGLAAGDLDGDGDLDLIRTNNNGEVVVIENRLATGHWLIVKPAGALAVGCRVRITAGAKQQERVIVAGDSFLSCGPPEAHFGLGSEAAASEVEVRWPDGRRKTWQNVAADQRFIARAEP